MISPADLKPLVQFLRDSADGLERGDNPLILLTELAGLCCHLIRIALPEDACPNSTAAPAATSH